MAIKVRVSGGKAFLYTPYNPDFVDELKSRVGGARWNGEAWVVPEHGLDAAREVMRDVYGETDLPDSGQRFTVRVTVLEEVYQDCSLGPIYALGKLVASARSRDGGARVGEDVQFVHGSPVSGGSRNHPATIIEAGGVFIVHNVTQAALDAPHPKWFSTEVIENDRALDRAALEAEREKLVARLAEIDSLLASA